MTAYTDLRIHPRTIARVNITLYVSLTNAIAVSPTDTMPLTRRAKGLMAIESREGCTRSLECIGLACREVQRTREGPDMAPMVPLAVSTGVGIGLGVLYFVLLVTLGILSLRKGHWVMFIIGIFFPLFWLIGALLPPR